MEYMEQQMQNYIEAGISEADRCYARIAELEGLNQELAATVEALRAAGNEVYAELQQWALTESHKETDRVFALWRKARAATPQQHLAEIRAQAVMDAVVSHEVKYGNSQFGRHLREYADSIRRGEVE